MDDPEQAAAVVVVSSEEAPADRPLERELLRVAVRAGEHAAGAVEVLSDDVGPSAEELPARLQRSATRLFGEGASALLLIWPGVPRLRRDHLKAALGDLAAGCDLVLGPMIQGGFYLEALREPHPELFELPGELWVSEDVMGFAEATRQSGLELGILQAERALRSSADVRAALADPLLPDEVRRALECVPDTRPSW